MTDHEACQQVLRIVTDIYREGIVVTLFAEVSSDVGLAHRPVDDREIKIDKIGHIVRDQGCTELPCKGGDEQVGVIVRSASLSPNRPQFGRLGPHVSIVVDPLKCPGKAGQLIELSSGTTVT